MKFFTFLFISLITIFAGQTVVGQSVLDPTDPVITYNGSTTPAQPVAGTIGKWIRTRRLSWNTDSFKCYIYKGSTFRLRFPKSYKPGVSDGKKYPMILFFHGLGEAGPITDNEYQMYHGGNVFSAAADNGTYDGYLLFMQSAGYWGAGNYQYLSEIIDYMITNNKLDPFRVTDDGLSAGGQGTWQMLQTYPTYIAGCLPISHIEIGYESFAQQLKFTPIWNTEGGLDGAPAPNTGEQVRDVYVAAGANFQYKEYPTLGHGCWDSVWQEPKFWPFMNNAYMSNPWTLFGRTQFCPGDPINLTIGLVPGLDAYQWRMNGVVMPGATTNTIQVTQAGTYDARVLRNGNWSDWSHTPAVVGVMPPTVTPPISVSGQMSDVLPGADGLTYVNLQVPNNGYTSYTWKKVGSDSVIGNQRILKATQPGQYIVAVSQQYGCSSIFSPAFTVVSASGPNAPSPAGNLVATTLSYTQVQLSWAQNPNPTYQESGFEIYRSTTSGGPYSFVGLVPKDTIAFLDNNLTPNIKYFYTVRAINNSAAAAISNEASAVTQSDKIPPTAPPNLRVITSTTASITIAWDSATDNVGVNYYAVYVNGNKATTATTNSYIVDGLQPNKEYSFYVVAVDGSGNVSPKSNQVSAGSVFNGLQYKYYTMPATATAWSVLPNFSTLTPTSTGTMPNVSIANTTQTTNFGYIWQGYINIPVAGTYTFATSSDDGSAVWFNSYTPTGTPLVNNDGSHGTVTATGSVTLQPGTYPICIEYFQGGGGYSMNLTWACQQLFGNTTQVAIANQYFASSFNPGGTAPAIPTQIKAIATSYNKVNVSWTDNSTNETGFEVYRATSTAGPFTIVTTTGAGVTAITDSTVQAATTYYYKVQAVNLYGGSGYDPGSLSGLSYNLYTIPGTWSNMSGLNALTPVSTGYLPNISLSPATTTTNFAFKFSGYITIPTTGSYTFYTASDDGSDLYVGGYDSAHLVVKNDFLQGTTQRSGTVTLAKGNYPFYVTFFQSGGGYALTTSYQGPGITQQAIPNSAFNNGQSVTTTFALPTIPSTPFNVIATALSSSKIKLTWQDTSATVTGYALFRSIGDTLHFIQAATLPASPTSYCDTALFSRQAYNYKIGAIGIGGNSTLSPVATATTLDIAPVITKLVSQSARYGTSSVIALSATTVNSGGLSFTAPGLPAFALLTDNGNGTASLTLNPAIADQGVFPIAVYAKDIYGGTDSTKFNLTVNNNYAPTLDTIPDITMNEGDSLNVILNAHDQNATDVLTFTVTNLPNVSTQTITSNGRDSVNLHPTYIAAGTYAVQVNVNDGNGGQANRSFKITVNYKDPNLNIYARVQNTTVAPAPWNNLTGSVTANLKDAHGNTTPVGLNIQTNSWATNSSGPTTGNNSGVYPDAVLNEFFYFGLSWQQQTINGVISGLTPSSKYSVTFFAASNSSVAADNGSTNFTIGSQTVSLYVQNNTKNTITINSVSPAADGTITFTMAKGTGATAGFLNAIVISNLYDDGTTPAPPSTLTGQYVSGQGTQLSWQSIAYNATGFQVYRSINAQGPFTQIGTISSATMLTYTDSTAASNTQYYYEVNAINAHGASTYSNVYTLLTPNRVPQITAIANVTLKNNQTQTINVTTTDDSTAHLRLIASGLPSFASFTDNGNGTGVIKIIPQAGTTGSYPGVTITVKDALDSSRSTSFNITIVDKDVTSIYINSSDGIFLGPKPWNNFTAYPNAGATLTNLMDDGNNPSGISMTVLDAFAGLFDRGMHPGNGQTVYPESAIRSAFFETTTNTKRIQISGLSAAKKYNFVFFNSHDFGLKCLTNFTIGSQTVTLDAAYNNNKTVQINGITADANGNALITVQKNSSTQDLAVFSTLVIQSYDKALTLLSPTDLRIVKTTTSALSLQWADRSFDETGFQIWRAKDSTGGQFSLLTTLPANTTSYKDSSLKSNSTFYYIVRAVKNSQYSAYTSVASATTYSSNVYVQCTGVFDAPAPWNPTNAAPVLGYTWNNFLNDQGIPTSTGMVCTSPFSEVNPLGNTTGNNSGVYPDNLLQYSYYVFPGITGGLQLTGLNIGAKYNLAIIASNAGFGDINTAYTIAGKTYYLNCAMNIGNGVLNIPVTADQNGQVNLTVTPGGSSQSTSGCLNAFILSDYAPAANPAPQAPSTNIPPVISKLSNTTMRYGTSLVIPVSATDANGDTLSFTISAKPSFGTFVDNGNGTATLTLNPALSTNQGTYSGIKIVVSDGKGGKDSTSFTLTVNNDYPPVIAAIPNYTVQEGNALTINLSATDQTPGNVMTWTITGLPNTYTASSPSNGAETIALTPNTGTAGTYTVTASVNDGMGGTTQATFTVTVTTPANKTIYARIQNSNSAPAPWNNITGQQTNNLLNASGIATTVNLNLSLNPWASNSSGPTTGNNSGVYPDVVLTDFLYFGLAWQQSTVTGVLSGMDPAATYTITFYAGSNSSVAADNGYTNYTIGSQTVTLHVQNNTQNTVAISNVAPAADGTITFIMSKGSGATAGFLNALVIGPPSSGTSNTGQDNKIASLATGAKLIDSSKVVNVSDQISAYPNPFQQTFTLSVPAQENDRVLVSMYNVGGQIVFKKEFDNLYEGKNNLLIDVSGQISAKGVYMLKIDYVDKPKNGQIRMIKL